jgi:hypothetical protein
MNGHTLYLQVADRADVVPIGIDDSSRDELDAMEVFGSWLV